MQRANTDDRLLRNQRLALLGFLLPALVSTGSPSFAQSAVDRAERTVRRQLAQPSTPAPRLADRVAAPGYLGVISDREDGAGVRLRDVIADGPAAKAGLQAGDLVTAINEQPIKQNTDMARILENSPVGTELRFTVSRPAGEEEISVILAQRPVAGNLPFGRLPDDAAANAQPSLPANTVVPGTAATGPRLGVQALPVTADIQRQSNLPNAAGALVTGVTVGSAAERAGIPVGAVITAIDDQPVADPDDLGRLIQEAGAGKEIEVTYLQRGQEFRRRALLGGAGAAPLRPQQGLTPVQPQASVGSRLSPGAFDDAGRPQDRIEALEQRIRELEARIARLEAALQPETASQSGTE